ncbi:MAG TPA: GFA family protein [Lysobacter sp.]|nr:GFA family protein [Lysobacter sp.]
MPTYKGSCHCGAIVMEVDGELDRVIECNCSICQRRGSLLWFVPRDALRLDADPTQLGTYRFNTHRIDHHFCTTCGIAPYSEGANPDGSPMAAINVRCLEDVELDGLTRVRFDGRRL